MSGIYKKHHLIKFYIAGKPNYIQSIIQKMVLFLKIICYNEIEKLELEGK